MYFDTHFHLDLVKDPYATAQEIEKLKIYTLAVTNLPAVFSHTEQLCSGLKYLRPAIGYHPELAAQYPGQLNLFAELLDRARYVGEIGLDNLKKTAQDYQIQKRIFGKIIQLCADQTNKILTIHSRRAVSDVLSTIGERFPGKVILHWFSGSTTEMELALSRGYYFSINLNMTQSQKGREIIKALPSRRILLETDGPFTQIHNQPCSPIDSKLITEQIISIKLNEKIDLYRNFKELLDL